LCFKLSLFDEETGELIQLDDKVVFTSEVPTDREKQVELNNGNEFN